MQIRVPGNWETQGFGQPVYTNFKYPFPVKPPYVPEDNPTGCYRLSFTLPLERAPEEWRMTLAFDGVDSAFCVWLNGTFVGYSQDSRLPAEFDITGTVAIGNNLLAVQVCHARSSHSVTRQLAHDARCRSLDTIPSLQWLLLTWQLVGHACAPPVSGSTSGRGRSAAACFRSNPFGVRDARQGCAGDFDRIPSL